MNYGKMQICEISAAKFLRSEITQSRCSENNMFYSTSEPETVVEIFRVVSTGCLVYFRFTCAGV